MYSEFVTNNNHKTFYVLPKPRVTDPEANGSLARTKQTDTLFEIAYDL